MLKEELKNQIKNFSELDRKVLWILITIPLVQTISSYFTSRRFFRENLFYIFQDKSDPYLFEFIYWLIGDTLLALLPAFIIIRIVFKDKLTDYGFQLGDWKLGLKLTVVFSLFMIILLWIVTASEDFIEKYPLLNSTKYSFQTFIIYQVLTFIYLTGWEFTWRGFMLFGLEKKFGYYAVVIQMIPFTLLHFGKPFLETLSSIPGGIALGVLALRTRSFYYCLLVHFSVMFAIDTISILRFHSNEFAIGINSFINLIKTILGY